MEQDEGEEIVNLRNMKKYIENHEISFDGWIFFAEEDEEGKKIIPEFDIVRVWKEYIKSYALIFYKKAPNKRIELKPSSAIKSCEMVIGFNDDDDDESQVSIDVTINEDYKTYKFIEFEYEGKKFFGKEPITFRKTPLTSKERIEIIKRCRGVDCVDFFIYEKRKKGKRE